VNVSCGIWADADVALLPGSIDVNVWLRKSEEGDPEPVCERSVEGRVNWLISKMMIWMPLTVTKGEGKKPFGSECSNELPGALVQEAGYSDGGVEKWWTEGGGEADEWESEVGLPSEEGSPSIAVRMEYSRLAASEPKVKDAVLHKGSFAVKPFMTINKLVRQEMRP
jgi:hypothetical protein